MTTPMEDLTNYLTIAGLTIKHFPPQVDGQGFWTQQNLDIISGAFVRASVVLKVFNAGLESTDEALETAAQIAAGLIASELSGSLAKNFADTYLVYVNEMPNYHQGIYDIHNKIIETISGLQGDQVEIIIRDSFDRIQSGGLAYYGWTGDIAAAPYPILPNYMTSELISSDLLSLDISALSSAMDDEDHGPRSLFNAVVMTTLDYAYHAHSTSQNKPQAVTVLNEEPTEIGIRVNIAKVTVDQDILSTGTREALKQYLDDARIAAGIDDIDGSFDPPSFDPDDIHKILISNTEFDQAHELRTSDAGVLVRPNGHTTEIETANGHDIVFGHVAETQGLEISTAGGNDTITGSIKDDIILPGKGEDYVYAGEGDDTIKSDHGIDKYHGQDGYDSVVYEFENFEFGIRAEILDWDVTGQNHYWWAHVLTGGSFDDLRSIEKIVAPSTIENRLDNHLTFEHSNFAWRISVSRANAIGEPDLVIEYENFRQITGSDFVDKLEFSPQDIEFFAQGGSSAGESRPDLWLIDLGKADNAGSEYGGDKVDLGASTKSNTVDARHHDNQKIDFDSDGEVEVILKSAETIQLGSGNDKFLGGGKHDGKYTEVYLGAGDDVVEQLSADTVIYTGSGADKGVLGKHVLYADLSSNDKLTNVGHTLTGAVKSKASEKPYALNGTLKFGLNKQGDLIIKNHLDFETFVAAPKVGPETAAADRTAGLYVFEKDISAVRLLDPNKPKGWLDAFFRVALHETTKALTGQALYEGVDPLVLDLDGDGIELTSRSAGSLRFDLDGDGFAEPTGWVLPDDGLLALDINGNGTIDDISELFGSPTQSGYAELAAHDGNADQVIDAADAVFADLRVWQDANRDGVTDAGELKTLAEAGITSIGLTSTTPAAAGLEAEIAGNIIDAAGTFTRTDGSTGTTADVRFRIDNFDTVYLGDTTVSAVAEALPNLKGRGTLADLHVAMTQDPVLLSTVQTVMPTLTLSNPFGADLGRSEGGDPADPGRVGRTGCGRPDRYPAAGHRHRR